jgi:hypothetical protein
MPRWGVFFDPSCVCGAWVTPQLRVQPARVIIVFSVKAVTALAGQ